MLSDISLMFYSIPHLRNLSESNNDITIALATRIMSKIFE